MDRGLVCLRWIQGISLFRRSIRELFRLREDCYEKVPFRIVNHSRRSEVDRYIRNQCRHPERFAFQDKFRALRERHEIEIDERFLWD